MTDLERAEMNFQRQIDFQNARIDKIDVKLDAFIQEMRDFKTEMRDRDNQRAAETAALRAEMISRDDKLAAAVDGMGKHVRNITIAAFVGVGAAVIGVIVGVGTIFYTALAK